MTYVMSWTVLIVLAIQVFDIVFLPKLFILYGLLSILGFFLFKNLISSKNRILMIIGLSFLCSLFLLLSSLTFISHFWLFAFLLMFTLSVFWTQLKIAKLLFFESLFSPTQSTRIFPLIESADTIGTVLAGFLISILSFYFDLSLLLAVSAIFVLINIPILFFFNEKSVSLPARIMSEYDKVETMSFKKISRYSGVLFLAVIILLQFGFFYVLEFQFLDFVTNYSNSFDDPGHHSMAVDLGFFHMIIGFITLLYQFFLASRVMNSLGVIKSLLLSPIIMICSLFYMIVNPGFLSLLFLKTNHDISDVTFLNAYHSTFYAFKHSARSYVMEFLEGFVKPLGMILASLLIILVFDYLSMSFLINVSSLFMLSLVLWATYKFNKDYVNSPKSALLKSNKYSSRLNAISILNQNPDQIDFDFLHHYLIAQTHLASDLQSDILKLFSEYADCTVLDNLFDLLAYKHIDDELIFEAISVLIRNNLDEIRVKPFTFYHLLKKTKTFLDKKLSKKILIEIYLLQTMISTDAEVIEKNLEIVAKLMDSKLFQSCSEVFKLIDDENVLKYIDSLNLDFEECAFEIIDLHLYYGSSKYSSLLYKYLFSENKELQLKAMVLIINYDLLELFNKLNVEDLVSMEAKFVFNCFHKQPDFIDLKRIDIALMSRVLCDLEDSAFKQYLISNLEASINSVCVDTDSQNQVLTNLMKVYHMLSARKEYFMVKDLL